MTRIVPVRPDRVRVGDMADHKSRTLDPRPVAVVDPILHTVCLRIGPLVSDPLPRINYTFYRLVANP